MFVLELSYLLTRNMLSSETKKIANCHEWCSNTDKDRCVCVCVKLIACVCVCMLDQLKRSPTVGRGARDVAEPIGSLEKSGRLAR